MLEVGHDLCRYVFPHASLALLSASLLEIVGAHSVLELHGMLPDRVHIFVFLCRGQLDRTVPETSWLDLIESRARLDVTCRVMFRHREA